MPYRKCKCGAGLIKVQHTRRKGVVRVKGRTFKINKAYHMVVGYRMVCPRCKTTKLVVYYRAPTHSGRHPGTTPDASRTRESRINHHQPDMRSPR